MSEIKIKSLESNFEKLGLDTALLSKELRPNYTVANALINSERSPLLNLKVELAEVKMQINGKLRAEWNGDNAKMHFIGVSKDLNIPNQIQDFKLTETDKQNLKETGHLGRLAKINNNETFLSVDKDTNTIISTSAKNINIPKKLLGQDLTEEQQQNLKEGKKISLNKLEGKSGTFNAEIQVDASKKGLAFKQLPETKNTHSNLLNIENKEGAKEVLIGKEISESNPKNNQKRSKGIKI